jgi:hypothetical protein
MVLNEFGAKFWQSNATRAAQMSSPAVTPPSRLVDVAYSLFEHNSSGWLSEPLVDSLNNFLATSHRAFNLFDSPIIEKRADALAYDSCD